MSSRRISGLAAVAGAALLLASLEASSSQAAPDRPMELGRVAWLRDWNLASARSASDKKPIFLLFQEVPGCQTCVSFGEAVLSDPLLVEAIEDEFVPLAILNNQGGADRRVLERFGEPAWNNPVVRFVSADGRDLIPRRDRIWRAGQIATRMIESLEAAGRPVPAYLQARRDELEPSRIETATLSMGCYWGGEACLGALPGLLSSRAAHLVGREVVELRFEPSRLPYRRLLEEAQRRGCADGVFAHDPEQLRTARAIYGDAARLERAVPQEASARNQKFHLKRDRRLARLGDLTPAQSSRLNHAAWAGTEPAALLSPRQRERLD